MRLSCLLHFCCGLVSQPVYVCSVIFQGHIEACAYKSVTCPHSGCGQLIARSDLEEHARGCPHRLVKCDYCHLQVPLNKKQVKEC